MGLEISKQGSGYPLYLLHGWGMHSEVWQPILPQLSNRFELMSVDLPGHGLNWQYDEPESLEEIVDHLAAVMKPAAVLGWSLGGVIAAKLAAKYPELVKQLILCCWNPCFCIKADWQHALPLQECENLWTNLQNNYFTTINNFLFLQVKGYPKPKELHQKLSQYWQQRPVPILSQLENGLKILQNTDCREFIHEIKVPTLCLFGEEDFFVPQLVYQNPAQWLPEKWQIKTFKNATHVPFITEPELFSQTVNEFLRIKA